MIESLKRLVPLLGLAAAIAYGLLRLAYFQFYSRFGLLPEAVGLGQTEILTQALIGPVIAVLLVTAFLAGYFLYMTITTRVLPHLFRVIYTRLGPSSSLGRVMKTLELGFQRAAVNTAGRMKRIVVVAAAASTLLLFVYLSSEAADAADFVIEQGLTIPPGSIGVEFGIVHLPLLDVKAVPVDVEWIGRTDDFVPVGSDHCLMLLGEHDGNVLMYDVPQTRTITVPSSSIRYSVSVNPNPTECELAVLELRGAAQPLG